MLTYRREVAGRPLVDRSRSWTTKSGGRLSIGDKHKAERAGGPDLRSALTCDLEPMAPGAGHRKAEGARLSATSIRRNLQEALTSNPQQKRAALESHRFRGGFFYISSLSGAGMENS